MPAASPLGASHPIFRVTLQVPGRGFIDYLKDDCRSSCLAVNHAMKDANRDYPDVALEKIRVREVRRIDFGHLGH